MKIKLGGVQKDVVMWGGIGLAGIALVYVVIKYALPALTNAVGGAAKTVATSVANTPAGAVNALTDGAGNLTTALDGFFAPIGNWWAGLDIAPTPAAVPIQSAVDASNSDMGGKNFGVTDGATW